MRYCIRVFVCSLSRRLKSAKSWLVLLLLPVCILATGHLTEAAAAAPVTVGVVLPESGGDALWSLLEARSSEILVFVPADADTVDRNVAAGKWDCGFVFATDFDRRVEELDLDESVVVRISAGSAAYPLVQETVSACITQLAAPVIAREYLMDSGIAIPESMEQRLEEIRAQTRQIGVTMMTLDGAPMQVPQLAQQGMNLFLCWLVCAVILVRMLFGAADLGKWMQSAAAGRLLPLRSAGSTLAAKAAADGFLMAVSGVLAMLLLKAGAWGCLAVLGYVLFWMSAAVFLARFPGIHQVLPICVPFAVVTSFLLSSVLVDIGIILPAASGICRWLPVSLYLRACEGSAAALVLLLAAALVCGLASWALDRLPSKVDPLRLAR